MASVSTCVAYSRIVSLSFLSRPSRSVWNVCSVTAACKAPRSGASAEDACVIGVVEATWSSSRWMESTRPLAVICRQDLQEKVGGHVGRSGEEAFCLEEGDGLVDEGGEGLDDGLGVGG